MAKREKLTAKMMHFIDGMMKLRDQTKAAEHANYAYPAVDGCKLMKKPAVLRELRRRQDLINAKADQEPLDLLNFFYSVITFEPLQFFEPGYGGGWLCDESRWKDIPPKIGRLITEMQRKETKNKDGEVVEVKYWVKIFSKEVAGTLAAKYTMVEPAKKVDLEVSQKQNWEELAKQFDKPACNVIIDGDTHWHRGTLVQGAPPKEIKNKEEPNEKGKERAP